jgi:hypothetical protein
MKPTLNVQPCVSSSAKIIIVLLFVLTRFFYFSVERKRRGFPQKETKEGEPV